MVQSSLCPRLMFCNIIKSENLILNISWQRTNDFRISYKDRGILLGKFPHTFHHQLIFLSASGQLYFLKRRPALRSLSFC